MENESNVQPTPALDDTTDELQIDEPTTAIPITPALPPVASGSTPKKRSKWDTDDALEIQPTPPKRKKQKKEKTRISPEADAAQTPQDAVAALSIRSTPSTPLHTSNHTSPPDSSTFTAEEAPPYIPPPRSRYVPSRSAYPSFTPCRSVYCYERLNHIEEGSYGVVFRARDKETGDIVAIKKLKLDEEKMGFPITSLREVMALMVCKHEHVVPIREIVVGDTLTQ